jgi:hypothetical protein
MPRICIPRGLWDWGLQLRAAAMAAALSPLAGADPAWLQRVHLVMRVAPSARTFTAPHPRHGIADHRVTVVSGTDRSNFHHADFRSRPTTRCSTVIPSWSLSPPATTTPSSRLRIGINPWSTESSASACRYSQTVSIEASLYRFVRNRNSASVCFDHCASNAMRLTPLVTRTSAFHDQSSLGNSSSADQPAAIAPRMMADLIARCSSVSGFVCGN